MISVRLVLGLLFISLICGARSIAGGDIQFQVRGSVTNFLGGKIPGIPVIFTSGQQEYSVKTTESGAYSIRLAPGLYAVGVPKSSDFCATRRSNFVLERGQEIQIDFELFVCGIVDTAERFDQRGLPVAVNMEEVYREHVGYNYEELPEMSISGLKPLVEFGRRRERGAVEYTGIVQQGHYIRPVLTYNVWTLRANSILYDSTTQLVSAQGNVTWQDGKTTQSAKSMNILFHDQPQVVKIEQ